MLSTASCLSRLFPSGEDGAASGSVRISTPQTRPEADEELPIALNGIKLHPLWTAPSNHSFDFATVELVAPSVHLYAAVDLDASAKESVRRLQSKQTNRTDPGSGSGGSQAIDSTSLVHEVTLASIESERTPPLTPQDEQKCWYERRMGSGFGVLATTGGSRERLVGVVSQGGLASYCLAAAKSIVIVPPNHASGGVCARPHVQVERAESGTAFGDPSATCRAWLDTHMARLEPRVRTTTTMDRSCVEPASCQISTCVGRPWCRKTVC